MKEASKKKLMRQGRKNHDVRKKEAQSKARWDKKVKGKEREGKL